ncbi:hypothetical protein FGG08_000962 [Glutinoglossum americanum]|uniref:Uncharacterized protein n=1 Tax=Glutinoglossum americanum TaxID=1670608 RepID=A0A9P8IFK1_9PEZI|nr:hypothetical protein FGG08_000962 [Glutinoglossum americanum]
MAPVSKPKPPFGETDIKNLRKDSNADYPHGTSSSPNIAQETIKEAATASDTSPLRALLPASYRISNKNGIPKIVAANTMYIKDDLSVKRLNDIHSWLWLAGRPMPPRPLNYQLASSRAIVISEQMDLHLVWTTAPRRIFVKPIPSYLLDQRFFTEDLVGQKEGLYGCALGFLLSYTALIQYESDFNIAKDKHLLPKSLTWDSWVDLVEQLLANEHDNINMRYLYGELRLSRLNKICWAHGRLRGYRFSYQSYGEMFTANLAPVTGITVYIALVLTAMQVGLATHTLGGNDIFQEVSYKFSVFSILAPAILLLVVILIILVFMFYNWMATALFRRQALKRNMGISTAAPHPCTEPSSGGNRGSSTV